MAGDEGPVAMTAEMRSDVLSPWAHRGQRVGGPDNVSLVELDGRCICTQFAGGVTGRLIGGYLIEGAAAFDWFDSSTFPVHKGLPPFGSCL